MLRRISRITCGIAGAVLVVASASSCADNDASILIIGILAPPTSSGTGATAMCTYTANITGPFLLGGSTVDFAFTREYIPSLLIGNQLQPTGNAAIGRAETDNVNIEGAIVTVSDEGTGEVLDSYTVVGSAFAQPSSGGEPGLGIFATTIISPKVADTLGAFSGTKLLVSNVKVYGITSGGTHIESAEVPFEVNACIGCLVAFSTAADDPASPKQPNCDASSSSSGTTITPPCVYGQDQAIDCQLCAGQGPPYASLYSNTNFCEP
jgi:hypothetical protein